jgi:large subunit ribosomal protein L22
MDVQAIAKNVRVAPSKVRLLADMVRGKKVDEALKMLLFTSTPNAQAVAKTIKSAAANAEKSFQMAPEGLVISKIYVDSGMTMKRYRSAARGRVSPVLKRSSHITVVVTEQENHGAQS